MKEYLIPPCTGCRVEVKAGQKVTVLDVEGGQVADFFAEVLGDSTEFLSTGVTIDCNESLRLSEGDVVYSNRYRPLLKLLYDEVGEHDLLHPCCRPEMYDFFYGNGNGHPNCLDNVNGALGEDRPIVTPINLFMHTVILPDGKIAVERPLSEAGQKVTFEVLTDLVIAIAACSVSESKCNGGKCGAIKVTVEDGLQC